MGRNSIGEIWKMLDKLLPQHICLSICFSISFILVYCHWNYFSFLLNFVTRHQESSTAIAESETAIEVVSDDEFCRNNFFPFHQMGIVWANLQIILLKVLQKLPFFLLLNWCIEIFDVLFFFEENCDIFSVLRKIVYFEIGVL